LFLEQFLDRQILDSVEIDSVRLVLFRGDQERRSGPIGCVVVLIGEEVAASNT
jgi:hypothetical protein